jgi:uncharacterized membrane protein
MNRRILLGAAVAGILSAATRVHADPIPKERLKKMSVVPCYGVNACKAQGQCAGAHNACAGNNECKGQGWLAIPKESCLALPGGSLTPPAPASKG